MSHVLKPKNTVIAALLANLPLDIELWHVVDAVCIMSCDGTIRVDHGGVTVSRDEVSMRLFASRIHWPAIITLTLDAVALCRSVRWAESDMARFIL